MSEIIEALQKCELFGSLSQKNVEQIATLSQVLNYEAGETVFTQGEYKTELYLILEGQIAVLRRVTLGGREATVTIALLGRGRGLGLSALVGQLGSASASAVCQKPTTLISLDGAKLREILENRPEMGWQVMERAARVLYDRLRSAYGAMDTFR